jgi:hypothetical protein
MAAVRAVRSDLAEGMVDQATVLPIAALVEEPGARTWTRRRAVALALAYAVGLLGMMLTKGLFISPDRYFLILLVPALVLGVAVRYVADFLPFVALVLLYEFTRGYGHQADVLVMHWRPHYEPMIMIDRLVGFGTTPPELLQRWFWSGHLRLGDYVVVLFDHAHFFVPPTLLFIIWLERRDLFYRGAVALLIAAFTASLIFFLYPAIPPWLAGRRGALDVVSINAVYSHGTSLPGGASLIEKHIPANYVAAVPSLHAAFALLTWLIARSWRPTAGRIFAAYPIIMWVIIVYLGDHYVADIIAGVVVALFAWALARRFVAPGGLLSALSGPFEAPLRLSRTFGGASE